MTVFRTLFIVLLLTALGMGVVWQRIEVTRLGYEVQRLRERRTEIDEQSKRLLYERNALSAPDRLMRLMRENNSDLAPPVSLVRLDEADGTTEQHASKGARDPATWR